MALFVNEAGVTIDVPDNVGQTLGWKPVEQAGKAEPSKPTPRKTATSKGRTRAKKTSS